MILNSVMWLFEFIKNRRIFLNDFRVREPVGFGSLMIWESEESCRFWFVETKIS
jgi:hypothetical protein